MMTSELGSRGEASGLNEGGLAKPPGGAPLGAEVPQTGIADKAPGKYGFAATRESFVEARSADTPSVTRPKGSTVTFEESKVTDKSRSRSMGKLVATKEAVVGAERTATRETPIDQEVRDIEASDGHEPTNGRNLKSEEAVRRLDDDGEHKFLMRREKGPVYVVGTSVEALGENGERAKLHSEIRSSMVEKGIVGEPENVVGGYCRVDSGELLHWGPSTFPVDAATDEEFGKAVSERGVAIIDQLGSRANDGQDPKEKGNGDPGVTSESSERTEPPKAAAGTGGNEPPIVYPPAEGAGFAEPEDNGNKKGTQEGNEKNVQPTEPQSEPTEVFDAAEENSGKEVRTEEAEKAEKPHIEDSVIPPTEEGGYPQLPAIFGERTIYPKEVDTYFANWMKEEVNRAVDTAPVTVSVSNNEMVEEDRQETEDVVSVIRNLPDDAPIFIPPIESQNVPGLVTVDSPYDFYGLLTDAYIKSMPDISPSERKEKIDATYRHEMAHAARAKEANLPVVYGVRFSVLANMDRVVAFAPFVNPSGTIPKRVYREIVGAPRELIGTDRFLYDQLAPRQEE